MDYKKSWITLTKEIENGVKYLDQHEDAECLVQLKVGLERVLETMEKIRLDQILER